MGQGAQRGGQGETPRRGHHEAEGGRPGMHDPQGIHHLRRRAERFSHRLPHLGNARVGVVVEGPHAAAGQEAPRQGDVLQHGLTPVIGVDEHEVIAGVGHFGEDLLGRSLVQDHLVLHPKAAKVRQELGQRVAGPRVGVAVVVVYGVDDARGLGETDRGAAAPRPELQDRFALGQLGQAMAFCRREPAIHVGGKDDHRGHPIRPPSCDTRFRGPISRAACQSPGPVARASGHSRFRGRAGPALPGESRGGRGNRERPRERSLGSYGVGGDSGRTTFVVVIRKARRRARNVTRLMPNSSAARFWFPCACCMARRRSTRSN